MKKAKQNIEVETEIIRHLIMERVLVVGATGNIGISVIIAALRSKREVLAPVRNAAAAERLYQHVGTKAGITTVEADVTSDDGVQSIVDRVKAGELPHFQHVYSAGMLGSWGLLCSASQHKNGFLTRGQWGFSGPNRLATPWISTTIETQ